MGEKFKPTRTRSTPFSTVMLDKLKPESSQFEISEPGGLRIVVGKKSKSFAYRYKSPLTSKARKLTLGQYPGKGLSEARVELAEAKKLITQGVDPAEVKLGKMAAARDTPTVQEVIDEFKAKVTALKRSGAQDNRYLDKEIATAWGSWKISAVRRRDVYDLLDAKEAKVAADHLRGVAMRLFDFALERELIEVNPCSGIKPVGKAQAKQRVLSAEEIRQFWTNIDLKEAHVSPQVRLGLKFALATGQRFGEVRALKWTQIDAKEAMWTIPRTVSKNKLPHRVPLNGLALEILDEAKLLPLKSQYAFPGRYGDMMAKDSAKNALGRSSKTIGIARFAPHDLRRTATTQMTSHGIPEDIAGKIAGHAKRGVTAKHYNLYAYDREKREALRAWDSILRAILANKEASTPAPAMTPDQVVEDFLSTLEAAPGYATNGDQMPGLVAVALEASRWRMIADKLREST